VTEAVYGGAHANMAIVWTHMAVLLKRQGRLKEAIVLYEKVLKLRRGSPTAAATAAAAVNSSLVAQVYEAGALACLWIYTTYSILYH
jgi:hypothetical protein